MADVLPRPAYDGCVRSCRHVLYVADPVSPGASADCVFRADVFWSVSDTNLFLVLYMLFSGYFASIMIRLMLVISPIACVLAGIGVSETLLTFSHILTMPASGDKGASSRASPEPKRPYHSSQEEQRTWYRQTKVKSIPAPICIGVLAFFMFMFAFFVPHCSYMTANMYSSPQVQPNAISEHNLPILNA